MSSIQQMLSNSRALPYVSYHIVAGGGGSGGAGGGGGGVLYGSQIPDSPVAVVIVGAGGAGVSFLQSGSRYTMGQNGGNSSVFGQVAIGGGGGSAWGVSHTGNSGGSGGGGDGHNDTGVGGAPTLVPYRQGYAGGGCPATSSAGGGGGGAGNVGTDAYGATAPNGSFPGNGGAGMYSTISGTGTYYAGGGGGGPVLGYNLAQGIGGSGGGGNGGADGHWTGTRRDGSPGATNTGGGGGGGNYNGGGIFSLSGAGGSGVVFLSYPDTYPLALATTGSSTYSNVGGNHIYKFTSSGSLTF